MKFVEELKWRGMIQDIMPGTEEQFQKEITSAYIGFDPTANSLHIGSLVQIMILMHLQRCGHKPFALVGGATGMVGDPSGKSKERNLLDEKTLNNNLTAVQKQLEKFLDFNCGANSAEVVNNYDWFKNLNFLDFIRDAGKHISINYMMAKDSVKSRLETGMSFTEFSYQLVQGYDFYWLWKNKNCKVQLGGSDQWGNIVTGTELIRRKGEGKAFAITAPLIEKADGGKFGKTESGNIWLDKAKTSPYKFYQFWINASVCPNNDLIKDILSLETNESLFDEQENIIAFRSGNFEESVDCQKSYTNVTYTHIQNLWDIFSKNGVELKADFQLITKGRTSQKAKAGNNILGEENLHLHQLLFLTSLNESKTFLYPESINPTVCSIVGVIFLRKILSLCSALI